MNSYKVFVLCLICYVLGAIIGIHKGKDYSEQDKAEFQNEIENLYHAHINDSLWNIYLQDSLDGLKKINDSLLLKTETIRTKSNEIYDKKIRSIDNITLDSAISLRAEQRRQFRSTYGQ